MLASLVQQMKWSTGYHNYLIFFLDFFNILKRVCVSNTNKIMRQNWFIAEMQILHKERL